MGRKRNLYERKTSHSVSTENSLWEVYEEECAKEMTKPAPQTRELIIQWLKRRGIKWEPKLVS